MLPAVDPGMPAPFPHRYSASISRTFASRGRVDAPPRPTFHGGPSSEFDGDASTWSPEHLILSALGLSMLTTFEAFAARDGIEVIDWNATLDGTVERSPDGLIFSSIVLALDMELAGNVANAENTLDDAKQYCLILNSLRVPVVIEATIRTPQRPGIEAPQRIAG
jgi:organic hydroperoxide reductase OsmC/OhrA